MFSKKYKYITYVYVYSTKKMWGSFLNYSISTQSFLKNWDSYILVSYKRVSYKKSVYFIKFENLLDGMGHYSKVSPTYSFLFEK